MLRPRKYLTDALSRVSFIFRAETATVRGVPVIVYETVLLPREDIRPSNRPRVPGD